MVCIYCGSDTAVTNSRLQRRSNTIWRRRQCKACRTIFTTDERADYTAAILVNGPGTDMAPFLRDKLFLSIHGSLQHRSNATTEASALTDTVIAKLLGIASNGIIESRQLANLVQVALQRFDKAAAVHYQAFHQVH